MPTCAQFARQPFEHIHQRSRTCQWRPSLLIIRISCACTIKSFWTYGEGRFSRKKASLGPSRSAAVNNLKPDLMNNSPSKPHMKPSHTSTLPTRISRLAIVTAAFTVAAIAFAKPVPDNLANGLDKIVENNLINQGVITSVPAQQSALSKAAQRGSLTTNFATYRAAVAKAAAKFDAMAITDRAKRKISGRDYA